MNLIDKINKKQINPNVPEFRVGDIVKVDLWIKEGKKERIQAFEGIVTSIQGGSVSKRFTVRKKSGSVVVKRTFAVNSPLIGINFISTQSLSGSNCSIYGSLSYNFQAFTFTITSCVVAHLSLGSSSN